MKNYLWRLMLLLLVGCPMLFASAVINEQQVIAQTSTKSDRIRALDGMSRDTAAAKLGSRLAALWNGRQSGGALSQDTNTKKFDVAAGTYMVDGIYVADTDGADAVTVGTGANTSSVQYRKITVCIDKDSTYTQLIGTAATSQNAALKKACAAGKTEVAYIEIPNSFTIGTTDVVSGMLKQTATQASVLGGF